MPTSTADHVDVLIVGAGPAGLMAATWMAHMGVKTRVVDKRGTKVFNGQADGVALRTLELFDSFGLADNILKEGNRLGEMNMWFPGEDGNIKRGSRIPMSLERLSRFERLMVLHQGRIERFLLDKIREVSDIKVERGVVPSRLELNELQKDDPDAYPITIELEHLSAEKATPQQNLTSVPDGLFRSNLAPDDTDDLIRANSGREGTSEVVKAKYVVGCDGAHSWVRRQLGYELKGDATDFVWGVLDILPKTDFPDIRVGGSIHSSSHGSILLIPRERGIVRLYVQLNTVKPGEDGRADRAQITPSIILKAAQEILAPYKIEYDYCDWWTAYQVGQRTCKDYSKENRIFLAGDACHTHSPKVGQGMNVSLQDTFNLGWKLGLVAKGMAPRSILSTYQSERSWVADALINMDRKMSRMFSAVPVPHGTQNLEKGTISEQEMREFTLSVEAFSSGCVLKYDPSMLIAKSGDDILKTGRDGNIQSSVTTIGKHELATGIVIGQRMPSFKVLNQSDGMSWHLAEALKSDGRFRIVLFAGQIAQPTQMERIKKLCLHFEENSSFMQRYSPKDESPNPLIHLLTVHASPRYDIELNDFPETLRAFHHQRGYDYNCIFVDDRSPWGDFGDAYRGYGIDPTEGCLVVLRPDQHVGYIGKLDDLEDLGKYFDGILLPASQHKSQLAFQDREKILGGSSARAGNHADV